MLHARVTTTVLVAIATAGGSCSVAEFLGYWLHRLLHSDKIPALSRSHMIHHLRYYGPKHRMRPGAEYLDATDDRVSLGNIGLEWIVPSALLLAAVWAALSAVGVPIAYRAVSLCTMLLWAFFSFDYLHDRMHVEDFWLARIRFTKRWFLASRGLHDIHHRTLDASGRMDRNFGIGFSSFDRMFRTLAEEQRPLNRAAYSAAMHRYRELIEPDLMSHKQMASKIRKVLSITPLAPPRMDSAAPWLARRRTHREADRRNHHRLGALGARLRPEVLPSPKPEYDFH
jgi:Fatty acid hydroxylase superfamily